MGEPQDSETCLPERGSGVKNKYQETQGRTSAGSSSDYPLRASFSPIILPGTVFAALPSLVELLAQAETLWPALPSRVWHFPGSASHQHQPEPHCRAAGLSIKQHHSCDGQKLLEQLLKRLLILLIIYCYD